MQGTAPVSPHKVALCGLWHSPAIVSNLGVLLCARGGFRLPCVPGVAQRPVESQYSVWLSSEEGHLRLCGSSGCSAQRVLFLGSGVWGD